MSHFWPTTFLPCHHCPLLWVQCGNQLLDSPKRNAWLQHLPPETLGGSSRKKAMGDPLIWKMDAFCWLSFRFWRACGLRLELLSVYLFLLIAASLFESLRACFQNPSASFHGFLPLAPLALVCAARSWTSCAFWRAAGTAALRNRHMAPVGSSPLTCLSAAGKKDASGLRGRGPRRKRGSGGLSDDQHLSDRCGLKSLRP